MQAPLPLIALATGAALPSPLRAVSEALVGGKPARPAAARGRTRKLVAVLPARLQEDVRVVGALAELFATSAAEHLMNAGLTPGSDERRYRRPSRSPRGSAASTLPLIALAARRGAVRSRAGDEACRPGRSKGDAGRHRSRAQRGMWPAVERRVKELEA